MARLKTISEQERNAKALLRAMGATDDELDRLYDATYKARKRAEAQGAEPGKTLNLSWVQVLRNVKQAQARNGETVSQYIQGRRSRLAKLYKTTEVKKDVIERHKVDDGDWGDEVLSRFLKSLSGTEVAKLENDAIKELEEEGAIENDVLRDAYRNARARYEASGASTKEEWDKFLAEELSAVPDSWDLIRERMLEKAGLKSKDNDVVDKIREAQQLAEEEADTFDDEAKARRYLKRRKREVFAEYGL